MKNGAKIKQCVNKEIRVFTERMAQCNNEENCMSHGLRWDRQFQDIRVKMEESIEKLSNTVMITLLTHLCINNYFMSKLCVRMWNN